MNKMQMLCTRKETTAQRKIFNRTCGHGYHGYSTGRGVDPTGGAPGGGYHGYSTGRGVDPTGGAPGGG
ncbi:hypothetical protein F511_25874 [Dorcoceras hygrometricum]|uniref:Uncharacterized protein n=1 Tax=Dorcoceras hygrometricum TaxID=472368 RepID=A0A2Z7A560_9LAMI|nr:hypothetical protein F511_25874 [Dorcoceras hygrometricum]